VTAGPLAGKQFILYKALTTLGSQQQSDIYLFKDPNIFRSTRLLQQRIANTTQSLGAAYVGGSPVHTRFYRMATFCKLADMRFATRRDTGDERCRVPLLPRPIEPATDEQLVCAGCGTPHHSDCYADNGGCTVFGCSKAQPRNPN